MSGRWRSDCPGAVAPLSRPVRTGGIIISRCEAAETRVDRRSGATGYGERPALALLAGDGGLTRMLRDEPLIASCLLRPNESTALMGNAIDARRFWWMRARQLADGAIGLMAP